MGTRGWDGFAPRRDIPQGHQLPQGTAPCCIGTSRVNINPNKNPPPNLKPLGKASLLRGSESRPACAEAAVPRVVRI